MPVTETMELPVKLTEDEMRAIIAQHSAESSAIDKINAEKSLKLAEFRRLKKPHELKKAELQTIKDTGVEIREVVCEHRESLVNGALVTEVWRTDTNELVETRGAEDDGDPEDDAPDSRQPALPFAAPALPVQLCTAVDEDGVAYAIGAELADSLQRALDEAPAAARIARADIDGASRGIVAIRRGKGCDVCSIVGGHRPECAQMRKDLEAREEFDASFEANDTAAIAQSLDEPAAVAAEEQKLVPTKPKRTRKSNGVSADAEE